MLAVLCASSLALAQSKSPPNAVTLDWNKTMLVSKSTPTLQVVVNPMLRSGAPMHDGAFQALKQLGRGLRPLCSVAALSQARCR